MPSAWFHCTDNLSWHRGPCSSKTNAHRREEPWDVSSRAVKHMDKYSAWWKNKMKEEKGKKSRLQEKGFVRAYSSGGVVHQSREDSVARAGNWFYVYTQKAREGTGSTPRSGPTQVPASCEVLPPKGSTNSVTSWGDSFS